MRVPASQPCPGIPLLPTLAWSPAAPRWTDSELHCTFLTTLDAVVSLVTGRAGFSLWSAWLIPCRNAMVGIRRWGEEVTFSFSPLNRLGFQAQEVRASGDGNTGSRELACCFLPAATSTWRLQVLERGKVGGGSLQYSPHRPHPVHTLSSGLTSSLEMMPRGPIGCPQSPAVPWGKSSCVHLPCTLTKGSLAHSWSGGVSLAALIFLADKPPGPPLPQHPLVFSMTISTAPLEACFVLG